MITLSQTQHVFFSEFKFKGDYYDVEIFQNEIENLLKEHEFICSFHCTVC